MKKMVRRGFFIFVSLVSICIAVLLIWVSPFLHLRDGTVKIPGLQAPVELIRDQHGVPHIKANNIFDAYTALGYMHARDRFWQMEATRRLGAGTLAEIVGKSAVRSDMMMRTLGLERLANQQWALLEAPVQKSLRAYAKGVNVWLKSHRGALSPEFVIFGFKPGSWRPVDSLIWGKLMGLRLTRNWRRELQRYQLLSTLPLKKIRDLWPSMPPGDPVSIQTSMMGLNKTLDQSFAYLDKLIGPFSEASNAWAIAGRHTKSGKPILANDPHLGFSIPILWYLARIETPDQHLMGATVPGLPFHILGQNKNIAWGLTTTSGDTTDLFIEKYDPKDESRYLTPSGSEPFTVRTENINVKGTDPLSITVRETRHGPVISDRLFGAQHKSASILALKAAFLNPNDLTPSAIYNLNKAKNWTSFLGALENFHAPQQNFMYADITGNIGMIAAGRMPVRRHGQGWIPQAGWRGEFDWKKYIPYSDLPKVLNPPSGIIVNANNRVIDKKYPYDFSDDFAPGYRAKRITQMLKQLKPHTLEVSTKIQLDEVSVMAQEILPLMLAKLTPGLISNSAKQALIKLKAWHGGMHADRAEPLIFNAWLRELIRALAEDELGENFKGYWYVRPHFIRLALTEKNEWCDNVLSKEKIESCNEIVTQAFDQSVAALINKFGDSIKTWRWGKVHHIKFQHLILSKIPLIRSFFNITVETGGGQYTPNKGAYRYRDNDRLFENRHGAGYRGVYDLSDSAKSTFMIATGQSGHPLSSNYDHFIEMWKQGKSVFLDIPRIIMKKSQQGTIRFTP